MMEIDIIEKDELKKEYGVSSDTVLCCVFYDRVMVEKFASPLKSIIFF